MMTIKQFASLCGCNTQTLRYYDKIDLLKPVKVDQWSGYRYYAKSQAIDFVKIKNLQAADFTIDEIKVLLTLPDPKVYEAFDRKIAEQVQKLERIKEIQQSYLTEVNTMKNMINSFCDHLLERANEPEMRREFGMNADDAEKLVEAVRSQLFLHTTESGEEARTVKMVVDDKLFEGAQAIENMTFLIREEELKEGTVHLNADHICKEALLMEEDMETFWQTHGWTYTYEFLDQIPALEDGKDYTFLLRFHDKPFSESLSYPLFMIGAIRLRVFGAVIHCIVEHSHDSQNHFTLLRRN